MVTGNASGGRPAWLVERNPQQPYLLLAFGLAKAFDSSPDIVGAGSSQEARHIPR